MRDLLRKLVLVLVVVGCITFPKVVEANEGCNQSACFSTGYYTIWTFYGPMPCYWMSITFYDGTSIYQDCHTNMTY